MDKIEKLKQAATALKCKLEYYAQSDSEAAHVLTLMMPLFDRIERGEVVLPKKDTFGYYFSNPDGPLFKYDDLGEINAQYVRALELWDMKKRGLQDD